VTGRMAAAKPRPTSNPPLTALAARRVFFGHQSVGADILEGVREIRAATPGVLLQVTEVAGRVDLPSSGLVHARIGINSDPISKVRDFTQLVRDWVGDWADVALFKLCYVDVTRDTDVLRLFELYRVTMAELIVGYPTTRFAHVSVPLRVRQGGWKGRMKRLLGRPDRAVEDNAARHRFNELLRREYGDQGVLFDLAAAESTREAGDACVVETAGGRVPCLCPEYTHDGGHLNGRGRRAVAGRFLAFLAGQSGG
jgi:hypothetical protein